MKNKSLVVWIALAQLGLTHTCFAQKQPTLQQTTDWLASRIPEAGFSILYRYSSENTSGIKEDANSVTFKGCFMSFRQHYSYEGTGALADSSSEHSLAGTAQLGFLAAPWVKEEKIEAVHKEMGPPLVWQVVLHSQSLEAPAFTGVQQEDRNKSGNSQTHVSGANFSLIFQFQDKSLSGRVQKAFQHAISMCGGGKAEPF
jgi:hypothetical protein